jgi:hypothetical protein
MEIQFIDISSYQGISAGAEHFYAKVGEVNPKDYQESLVTSSLHNMTSFVHFVHGEELRYFPSEKEARDLWQKDHGFDKRHETLKYKEDEIEEYLEFGTIRFPDIKSIVKAAIEKFPNSVICFSFNGDRNTFAKIFLKMYESKNEKLREEAKEIISLLNI